MPKRTAKQSKRGLPQLKELVQALSSPKEAISLARLLTAGPSEMVQLGAHLLQLPRVEKLCSRLGIATLQKLLASPIYEERLLSLLILVVKFQKGSTSLQQRIYNTCVANLSFINDWELAHLFVTHILSRYLKGKGKFLLQELARSQDEWFRRIAIMTLFHCIKQGHVDDSIRVASILLDEEEGFVRETVGWMAKQQHKKKKTSLEELIRKYAQTVLLSLIKQGIEGFPEGKRLMHLVGL